MKKWLLDFWISEGKRLFYLFIVFAMGWVFIALGIWVIEGDVGAGLIGTGVAQLIFVVSIAQNKARSPEDKGNDKQ